MASASTLSTVAFIYKRLYSDKQVADMTMRDHVWWSRVQKEGGFIGDSFLYSIRYGNPQGIGGTLPGAQASAAPSKGKQLRAYRKKKYGVVTMDGEAIAASKGNKGAFLELVTMETDRIIEELGDSLAFDFWRDTTCLRGRGASAAGNVITLTDPEDARNFKEGMVIVADDDAAGGSVRTGSTTVTKVDEDAGTVTLDDTSDITGFQQTDYLFRSTEPGTGMEGLAVLTPLAAPSSGESFREIDRSVNVNRLAGSRLDDTTLNAEVALMRLAVKISKIGRSHNVDEAYVNPTHFFNIAQRLNAKVEYAGGGGAADVGFQSIMLHTAAGSMRVYADPDAPMNRGRVSREGSMYIKHLEGVVHVINDDGMPSLRQASDDGIEARIRFMGNLIQTDTSAQGVCSLPTS